MPLPFRRADEPAQHRNLARRARAESRRRGTRRRWRRGCGSARLNVSSVIMTSQASTCTAGNPCLPKRRTHSIDDICSPNDAIASRLRGVRSPSVVSASARCASSSIIALSSAHVSRAFVVRRRAASRLRADGARAALRRAQRTDELTAAPPARRARAANWSRRPSAETTTIGSRSSTRGDDVRRSARSLRRRRPTCRRT